uniref:Uncharacterized protein n=1 Tax=viral metagenome TaxID=1070528 RepID=A0A6C0JZG3_9ZZZZ
MGGKTSKNASGLVPKSPDVSNNTSDLGLALPKPMDDTSFAKQLLNASGIPTLIQQSRLPDEAKKAFLDSILPAMIKNIPLANKNLDPHTRKGLLFWAKHTCTLGDIKSAIKSMTNSLSQGAPVKEAIYASYEALSSVLTEGFDVVEKSKVIENRKGDASGITEGPERDHNRYRECHKALEADPVNKLIVDEYGVSNLPLAVKDFSVLATDLVNAAFTYTKEDDLNLPDEDKKFGPWMNVHPVFKQAIIDGVKQVLKKTLYIKTLANKGVTNVTYGTKTYEPDEREHNALERMIWAKSICTREQVANGLHGVYTKLISDKPDPAQLKSVYYEFIMGFMHFITSLIGRGFDIQFNTEIIRDPDNPRLVTGMNNTRYPSCVIELNKKPLRAIIGNAVDIGVPEFTIPPINQLFMLRKDNISPNTGTLKRYGQIKRGGKDRRKARKTRKTKRRTHRQH